MARTVKPLTDIRIKNAKPKKGVYRISDGKGLNLIIRSNGTKAWHMRYTYNGKENTISFGEYPTVILEQARKKREDVRRLIANGVDPSEERKAQKQARENAETNTFEVIAREWFNKQSAIWSESNSVRVKARLEKDLFPYIGKRVIAEINAQEYLAVLQRIESRVVETAHRVKSYCS